MAADKCPVCNGRCTVERKLYEPEASNPKEQVRCESCKGKGYVMEEAGVEETPTDHRDLTYQP